MDTTMQGQPDVRSIHSRKRSIRDREEDEDEIRNSYAAIHIQEDKPMKRLQNRYGEAIKRQPKHYNAQKLLNNLAFTRFHVTANFSQYNPTSSYIVLCMVAEQNELYQALCHLLPSLYQVAPSLQALAITTGYISPNATPDQALSRLLPLLTTVSVEVSVVEDFERFRQEVGGPEGSLAIIDANGDCLWTSTEFLDSRAQVADGHVDLQSLERSLVEVLATDNKNGDVDMDAG